MMLESLEGRRLFAGGVLDTSFGTGGYTVAVPGGSLFGQVAVDSGGRTYVLSLVRSANDANDKVRVRRLTPDGATDTRWAAAKHGLLEFGYVRPTGPTDSGRLDGFLLRVDAADRLNVLVNNRLYRYAAAGTVDTAFGSGGSARLADFSIAEDFDIGGDGHIYVSGAANAGPRAARYSNLRVQRLTARGRPDRAFASDSLYTQDQRQTEGQRTSQAGQLLRVTRDGSVVIVRSSGTVRDRGTPVSGTATVDGVKLTAAGRLDHGYGDRGRSVRATAEFGKTVVGIAPSVILADGTIVASYVRRPGTSQSVANNPTISADGKRLTTDDFGRGLRNDNVEFNPTNVLPLADGSRLVVDDEDHTLRRRLADGTYDAAFGANGVVGDVTTAAALPDGQVVVYGGDPLGGVVRRLYVDERPVADLFTKTLTRPATSLRFTVTYRSPQGVRSAGLNGAELRVFGPDGQRTRARVFGKTTLANGTVQVVYKVASPRGTPWSVADNGAYAVRLLAGVVRSNADAGVAARNLGVFAVRVA